MDLSEKAEISCLYVEDEQASREELTMILSRKVKNIFPAANGQEGLNIFQRKKPDLVITDIRMPVMDGLLMSKEILKLEPETKVIVTTAHSDTQNLISAIELGIDHYVLKPINLEKLYAALDKCIKVIRVRSALEKERLRKDELIKELRVALDEIKTLRGILPICAHCKKIRDDQGYWNNLEVYIRDHSDAQFSHGICPDCAKKHYPNFFAPKDR